MMSKALSSTCRYRLFIVFELCVIVRVRTNEKIRSEPYLCFLRFDTQNTLLYTHILYCTSLQLGIAFFNGSKVDLLKICDKCLVDVHRAATCVTRFDAIYHVPASEGRKEMLADMREKEIEASHMMCVIGKERIRRRTRDFCIRALELQRSGYKRLRDEELERESRELISMRTEEENQRKVMMTNKALSVDRDWIEHDLVSKRYDLGIKVARANLKYHEGFDAEKGHMSKEREHPLSWRLKDTDVNDTPITVQRAAEVFGTYSFRPEVHRELLQEWRDEGHRGHCAYLQREEDKARRKKEEYEEFLKNTRAYVEARMRALRRKEVMRQREAERREEDRLAQRVRDKIERRDARLARQEARERLIMAWEDEMGNCMRLDTIEEGKRKYHLRMMVAAEVEQRQIDRFWGIPTEKHRLWLLAEKRVCVLENFLLFVLLMVNLCSTETSLRGRSRIRTIENAQMWPDQTNRN